MKKLIDGKSLCAEYQIKTGPILKHLEEELMNFQIKCPLATADDALSYMRGKKDVFLAKYST